MASNGTQSQYPILNENTPFAFLSPAAGAQLEATCYLYMASLGAFLWDWFCTLYQDYRLLTRHRITLSIIVYFISRISTSAYIMTSTMFYVAPVGSCRALEIALGTCWAVAAPSTSLLFFFRVRAVFEGQRSFVAFFAILWLATLGGSIAVPLALTAQHIANTDRCIDSSIKSFRSAGIVASTCYDTLIFIAISWNIIARSTVDCKFMSFLSGRSLPYVSRELLRGGQQYYLITVGGNIITMVFMLSPSSPPVLRAMFAVPDMALANSMACRVFRNIKLETVDPNHHTLGAESMSPGVGTPAYALRTFGGTEIRPGRDHGVEIRKTVEEFVDSEPVHVVIHDPGKRGGSLRSEEYA